MLYSLSLTMVVGFCLFLLLLLLVVFAWYRANRPTHAGGIVYKNAGGKTLFLITTSATSKNKWVLPKGKIEKHEAPGFAATREVMEETGVQAKPVKKLGTISYRRKSGRVVVVYFLMAFEKAHNTSTENRRVRWADKDEVLAKLQRNEVKRLFDQIKTNVLA